jgi:hypothetical protein
MVRCCGGTCQGKLASAGSKPTGARFDRTACPWRIKKFVDLKAEFIFVPPEKIPEIAKKENAIPHDAARATAVQVGKQETVGSNVCSSEGQVSG